MAPSRSSQPSRPVRKNRTKVRTYHEDTTSDEETSRPRNTDQDRARRASVALRPRGRAGVNHSYREVSTDASLAESLDGNQPDSLDDHAGQTQNSPQNVPNPAAEAAPPAPRHARSTPSATASSRPRPAPAKRQRRQAPKKTSQAPKKKKAKLDVEDGIPVGPGGIPPWQTLPYQVLFDIFQRASYPLIHPENLTRNQSVKWLVEVAAMCRSFQEPALAALYHSPPLLPASKAHGLLDILSKPQSSLSINYAAKVKELYVEMELLLLYKSGPTLGYFDLSELVSKVPQLQVLRLYHRDDFIVGLPPWNIIPSKCSYLGSLFSALNQGGIYLRSWDWNARFLDTQELIPFMSEIHRHSAFRGLRELRLLHLGDTDLEDTPAKEAALADTIRALPEIERLELLECTLVGATFLPQLPATLRSLVLCNCDRVLSGHLTDFLKSHGQHLRELSLHNNRHLDMSFITTLGQHCPVLTKFKMDIQIHDQSSYRDTEPHFRELLGESEVPTWPASLQEIDLIQLRRWNVATAGMFFGSLVEAAPRLPHLRRLNVSAILKIGWRDRASFRERWINRLEKVFLRHSPPPDPNGRSLHKRPLHVGPPSAPEATTATARPSTAGSDQSLLSKRHSQRLATRKSFDEDFAESPGSDHPVDGDAGYVQGMCDEVNVRIDNLRPSEMQFNEADFLDDELSGDDDWEGDDYEPGDAYAW
ncbi:hypothetical protein N7492_001974 [Penicillium capsulatum]|uniref:Uncharacterized protein n=1 Tax=Penicillium capsulatum TaxID=69766 RepID=A0A9W9LVL5_9EURO|nr:hypothetical protein N7492_001974 [Penicillium capsulatum]KAJ6123407.1 hypothetical protein N7512_005872 [Penicillium capsulatum]